MRSIRSHSLLRKRHDMKYAKSVWSWIDGKAWILTTAPVLYMVIVIGFNHLAQEDTAAWGAWRALLFLPFFLMILTVCEKGSWAIREQKDMREHSDMKSLDITWFSVRELITVAARASTAANTDSLNRRS